MISYSLNSLSWYEIKNYSEQMCVVFNETVPDEEIESNI